MPCQHPVHSVRTHRRTEYVEKATEGDRRWSDDTGDRIGTGIQQNQMFARRHHGIEKQLPVFTAQIALPHNGITGQDVVAVDSTGSREHLVVESDQHDHAMRYRTHRNHRAHRQFAGSEVGTRRSAREAAREHRANIGQT